MALIFLLLCFIILLIWLGRRKVAIFFLVFTLMISSATFVHHISTQLHLNL
ncbi:DUF5993 family protein [Legionella israelensis]